MAEYIEILVDTAKVKVEVEPVYMSGEVPASMAGMRSKAVGAIDEVFDIAKAFGVKMAKTLNEIATSPTEASIEFGIKLDAEAGILVAKASSGAQFTVKLTWKDSEKGK